jgi:hypothetical protein
MTIENNAEKDAGEKHKPEACVRILENIQPPTTTNQELISRKKAAADFPRRLFKFTEICLLPIRSY